jgi:hypothetical protein
LKGGRAISHLTPVDQASGTTDRPESYTLSAFLADGDLLDVSEASEPLPEAAFATVLADKILQDIPDYRGAIRDWFGAVRTGGHLILIVPHAFLTERQMTLPVRDRPAQKRLYTPAALLTEVEQALVPNSYRVRHLLDDDRGYDYARPRDAAPLGKSDVTLVIEKIPPPNWLLTDASGAGDSAGPNYAFEPQRTRVEHAEARPRARILILKLDHLGDFVIGLPALERARDLFRDAHITLVVGSWNLAMAQSLNLADEVLCFDAFPRNSAEEVPDVQGKRALFAAMLPDRYDLAIDMRTDTDTRTLLAQVRAGLKAGIGRKNDFPFLDIPLALEIDRIDRESAREYRIDHHAFSMQDVIRRLGHRAAYDGAESMRGQALVWGPYWRLRTGHYLFEPFLEIPEGGPGLVMLDIAIEIDRHACTFVAPGEVPRLEFDVTKDDSAFEFRIWAVDDTQAPPFSFYGGKLIRQGAPGLLHQSDYLELLLDLIARRIDRVGLLTDIAQA